VKISLSFITRLILITEKKFWLHRKVLFSGKADGFVPEADRAQLLKSVCQNEKRGSVARFF
jgi:hypothetical protein